MEERTEERTYEDIIAALMADESWEVPEDLRPVVLYNLGWTLNNI